MNSFLLGRTGWLRAPAASQAVDGSNVIKDQPRAALAVRRTVAPQPHFCESRSRKSEIFCRRPVESGLDALTAPLPDGVRTICTNPPYNQRVLPRLVEHWLDLLQPVGGQLCLLLRSLWGESQRGQRLTTQHSAYAGRIKLPRRIRWLQGTPQDRGGSPQHDHAWFLWDWGRDLQQMPFEVSTADPRLKAAR